MSDLEKNLKNWKDLEARVVAKALEDPAFRVRLTQDPVETIEAEFHCHIQDGAKLRVREEESGGELTIMLPKLTVPAMSEKLNDGEMDGVVAAGNIGIAVSFVTSDIIAVTVIV